MAEKVEYEIELEVNDATKDLKKFNKQLQKTDDEVEDVQKQMKKSGPSIRQFRQGVKKVTGSFKSGLGIGIALKFLDQLSTAMMENQQIQDLMNQTMAVFQGLVLGVVEVLKPLFQWLRKAFVDPKQWWDDLVQSFMDGTMWIKENLIDGVANQFLRWLNSAEIGILKVRRAWHELRGNIEEARDISNMIQDLRLENEKLSEENAKRVEEIRDTIQDVTDWAVNAGNTIAQKTRDAFNNKELLADAEFLMGIMEANFTGIVEKYDLLAEKQRQIRDDESVTIQQRIEANERLATVLDEGQEKEIENVEARIGLLQQQQALLGATKDRELQILQLIQEKTAIEAKYAGLRSEQLTNINSLEKEGLEIQKSRAEAQAEADKILAEAEAENLEESIAMFEKRKEILDAEHEAFLQRNQEQIDALAKGTAAHQEALNERLIADATYTAEAMALEREKADFQKKEADKKKQTDAQVAQASVDVTQSALGAVPVACCLIL